MAVEMWRGSGRDGASLGRREVLLRLRQFDFATPTSSSGGFNAGRRR